MILITINQAAELLHDPADLHEGSEHDFAAISGNPQHRIGSM